MVKFSKELEAQLIPEWKEAFVNYWQLKKYVKRIRLSMKPKPSREYTTKDGVIGSLVFNHMCDLSRKIFMRVWATSDIADIIQVSCTSPLCFYYLIRSPIYMGMRK